MHQLPGGHLPRPGHARPEAYKGGREPTPTTRYCTKQRRTLHLRCSPAQPSPGQSRHGSPPVETAGRSSSLRNHWHFLGGFRRSQRIPQEASTSPGPSATSWGRKRPTSPTKLTRCRTLRQEFLDPGSRVQSKPPEGPVQVQIGIHRIRHKDRRLFPDSAVLFPMPPSHGLRGTPTNTGQTGDGTGVRLKSGTCRGAEIPQALVTEARGATPRPSPRTILTDPPLAIFPEVQSIGSFGRSTMNLTSGESPGLPD